LFALVSAPLFHVHDRDDHGNAGSFIHAHFPDVENPTGHSERAVETEHSHQHVRWIDVFTLSTPVPLSFAVVAEFSQPLSIPSPPVSRAVISLQTLRAHSPPEHFDLPPTSTSRPAAEPEALSRTEFTDRVENYFEYEPLHAGKPSQVRIHLTDLSDGSPVEKAEVTLTVSPKGSPSPVVETTSRIGKVTGIYVAEITVPKQGTYDIEFRAKNAKLDERIPLTDFKVE